MCSAKVAIASTALSLWAFSAGAATVTPTDAMGQVGHTAKVCGVVASAVYDANSRARPTFLTLSRPSRNQTGILNALRPRPCGLFLDDLPIHIRPDLPAPRVQT
jgi:hypothetical protein